MMLENGMSNHFWVEVISIITYFEIGVQKL